ncbi:hypothetical protein AAFF_G00278050 [Aldrovandia affinis]|uniref:Uncharacterized protein n=1 Tax=Aldrovandia affinis TaxID=143900 RepID=A0AAD7WRY9_9TELE|nr:hypothetical protein AAFF_G00278050 [Aldrovandia affinis]
MAAVCSVKSAAAKALAPDSSSVCAEAPGDTSCDATLLVRRGAWPQLGQIPPLPPPSGSASASFPSVRLGHGGREINHGRSRGACMCCLGAPELSLYTKEVHALAPCAQKTCESRARAASAVSADMHDIQAGCSVDVREARRLSHACPGSFDQRFTSVARTHAPRAGEGEDHGRLGLGRCARSLLSQDSSLLLHPLLHDIVLFWNRSLILRTCSCSPVLKLKELEDMRSSANSS